jgi:hypothetical protein
MIVHGPIEPTPTPQPTLPAAGPAESVRSAFRGLRALGLSEGEAANLSAHLAGLALTTRGWSLAEVERLLFIRSLVDQGRIEP